MNKAEPNGRPNRPALGEIDDSRPCPVCAGPSAVDWGDLYDDRYGHPGRHKLLRCQTCGHRFLGTAFTDSQLESLYSHFYPRASFAIEDFSPYDDLAGFAAWLEGERASAFRWVPRDVRVLDVGCGFGQTLAYHAARGCDAHGIDADVNLLRVARRFGLNARVGLFHAADYEPASFDYVTLDQVIEHVSDPKSFLADVAAVLRPGGVAIVTTPNPNGYGARVFGRKWINWHVPYHLQQFSRRSLSIAAEESGLRLASLRTLTSTRWLLYQLAHLLRFPPCGVPSPFWDPQRSPLAPPGRSRVLGETLYRFKALHVVTRLADLMGVGDNFVCVLCKPK